ncbi:MULTISPECIES: hypothetical protein [unclassified Xanthomonas]|uniref:hypothetical protein n=1 Tax=unclassified Xanthomonas TaxID=2643310 RepID=UPI0011B0EBED|nr:MULTISPECIES: hypothetical protein [unclassified Xanthomonas]
MIDWTATARTYPTGLGNTGWAALLGGAVSGIDLLVAQTGLVVRRTEQWPPPQREAAIEIHLDGQHFPRTGDRYMHAQRLLLIAARRWVC